MRVGHMGDQADAGGEEAGVDLGAGDALGEFGREGAADGRDVDTDLFEDLAGQLAADTAAARFAGRVGSLPWRVGEGRLAARFPLDLLECGADAIAQRLEPVARGLLLIVEGEHATSL